MYCRCKYPYNCISRNVTSRHLQLYIVLILLLTVTTVKNFAVVGHTMAYCYDSHQPGRHPPLDQSECSDGLIRASAGLQSICVDGGLYLGGRAFLEIGSDGHMRAFQRYLRPKVISSIHGPYFAMDLTELTCTVYDDDDDD
jgi:hypothetical protein